MVITTSNTAAHLAAAQGIPTWILLPYAKGVLSDTQTEDVIAAVNRLEDYGSIRKLMDALRAPAKRAERAA